MKRLAWVLGVALAACSAGEDDPGDPCDDATVASCRRDAGRVDTRVTDRPVADLGVPPTNPLVSIEILPAAPRLLVRDGVAASVELRVQGTLASGKTLGIGVVTWSSVPGPVGSVDTATGRFTAEGAAGGVVEVRADVEVSGGRTVSATTRVEVSVERSMFSTGTPPESRARFEAPTAIDPARAVLLHYPLDRAVMPENVPPPDVQWERGSAGDIYRVRLVRPHVSVAAHVLHSGMGFGYHWLVDAEAWRAVAESDPGTPVALTVDRWDSARNEVVPGPELSLRLARGSLSGTIYYWDLSEGKIMKLDALTGARSVAVPSPQPSGSGSRCIACHTISRDGRWMSVEMYGGAEPGTVYDLTSSDLGRDPAPSVFPPRADLNYLFSTFSPDGEYLAVNIANSLRLVRRGDGSQIPGSGLPATGSAHPEWSPDGRSLAYVSNTNGTWGVDFTRGDLSVATRLGETVFGPGRTIHVGASTPGGPVDAHPTFSPDNRWIAFQHGTNSRGGNETTDFPGRLELIRAAGGAPTPLLLATGGADTSYWPNFSPFNVGGYFWLAFYSRRDYGNAQAGTRGTHLRQIWVTAVRNNPTDGEDPSSVPYWLPGQDRTVQNMSAYWAPVACRTNGTECRVGSECCSGRCERQPSGAYACMAPPPSTCRRSGMTCSNDADCCEGLRCEANVCVRPPG